MKNMGLVTHLRVASLLGKHMTLDLIAGTTK